MRPLRVDLHGFTVFREPTTVDLTDADFYALVGPTGAGKSTVLDGICFALYGTVPRWGDRRKIENALAPSSNEARVRLVFEAAGSRYVATRVVRRDAKGKVSTSHAGLEQLPPGFDLATFDTAPADRDSELGTVLAGTPAEMDAAVEAAVGLPYEQFTSCVVLPQGDFARFLHAKPTERQEILVNLLGLKVYREIGKRAGVAQKEAEIAATATRNLLADVQGADDAALAAADLARTVAGELVASVEAELPDLAEAHAAGAAAHTALARVSDEIATLGKVSVPAGLATVGTEAAAAQLAADTASTVVHEAEEYEEKQRAELESLGDRVALERARTALRERATLASRVDELRAAMTAAKKKHTAVGKTVTAARTAATTAGELLTTARTVVEKAQTADRAGTLRGHLVAGEPCPVCEQPVATVPPVAAPALKAARTDVERAERALAAANATVEELDGQLRSVDRTLAAATAQHDDAVQRLSIVESSLTDAPPPARVEEMLTAIAAAEQRVSAAASTVRTARGQARSATAAAGAAKDRVQKAWRGFDLARDGVARFGPPAPDRDDLIGSWHALRDWADAAVATREDERASVLAKAEQALGRIAERVNRLNQLFAPIATAPRGTDPAAFRQAAALLAERADATHRQVVERREQATKLITQVARHDQDALVAKALALHLRSDRFERWLLEEALDALVAGASQILRTLSAGQYDLSHRNGEFYVIDHTDAGLARAVRTLSGGETFQASLALALALSEQLAGVSSAASLESIILDEGFGTLDASTLDTVAATLENLAATGNRSVGVVTHVAALAERIPVRFEVSRDGRGSPTSSVPAD